MTADLDSIYIRIDSTDSIKDTHIDWGTAANQVSAADIPMAVVSSSTFTTVQHMQDIFHSSGWVSGGVATDNGDNTVAVTDGTGLIKATVGDTSEILFFDWAENLSMSVPSDTTRYVGVEYNNGSPQLVVRTTNNFNRDTDFILASLINEAGTIHIQKEEHAVGDHANNMIERMFDTSPFARDNRGGGLIIGESGDGNRNITMSSGTIWEKLNEFNIGNVDTSAGGGDTFDRYLTAVGGGHTKQSAQTTWDNTQYDSSGTLTVLDNNKYAVQWFYIELDGDFVSVYGTAQYNSEGAAESESPPTDIPDRISLHGTLIGRIVFKESETTPRATQSIFVKTFTVAGVTDHFNLANIGTNTHAQIDTHITSDGSDHSFIDQDVTFRSSPEFDIITSGDGGTESIKISGGIGKIESLASSLILKSSANLGINLNSGDKVTVTANSLDPTGATTSLGISQAPWQDIFLSRNISDGTNALTVAEAKAAFDHVTADGSSHSFINQDVTTTATPTFDDITIFGTTPILVFKDSDSLGAASVGFIEWRDSGGGRAGFLGNNTSGDDGFLWKSIGSIAYVS